MVRSSVLTASISLLLSIKFIEITGKCTAKDGASVCDSLDDLYTYNSTERLLTIENPNNSAYRMLQPVPKESASKVSILEIHNSLNKLPEKAFVNFTNVFMLNLLGNKFKKIPSGAFRGLVKIQFLNITGAHLIRLQAGVFDGLLVQLLTLQSAEITRLDRRAFFTMENLHTLSLKNNYLTTFNAPQYISKVSFMQRLHLDHNKLRQINRIMLEGLFNLHYLNMNHNLITAIEPLAFAETPRLAILGLSHNRLRTISGNIFPSIGRIRFEKILINHNKMTYLPSSFLTRIEKLEHISIMGNPWQCPCLDLALRWLVDHQVKFWCENAYFSGERPICRVSSIEACIYRYEEEVFRDYNSSSAMYPKDEECPI